MAEMACNCQEIHALRARLAAVEAVHARYFDMDCRPCDAAPEPEDVWRYDRDFRAAARGDAQDRATEHNCCSCVDNIADDRDAAEARLAAVLALCDRRASDGSTMNMMWTHEVRAAATGEDDR